MDRRHIRQLLSTILPALHPKPLIAFTNTDLVDVSQLDTLALRPAKPLQVTKDNGNVDTHELQLRQATMADVKKRGAHESSRFYLLHPEKDPREQRNKERRDRIHRERGEWGLQADALR